MLKLINKNWQKIKTWCLIIVLFTAQIGYFGYQGIKQFVKEYYVMKIGYEASGLNIGGGEARIRGADDSKIIERYISDHGLLKYAWRFNELCYPVYTPESAFISSEKGQRIFRGRWQFHDGNDFISKYDLRARAMVSGTMYAYWSNLYGNCIRLTNDDWDIYYEHISTYKEANKSKVVKGQWIACMGDTGYLCQGINLHITAYYHGVNVNLFANSTWSRKVEL